MMVSKVILPYFLVK